MLAAWRDAGGMVVHTREAHHADLSDCPPAKRSRGNPTLGIGDRGPMGRILVSGEPGSQIIPELAPLRGKIVLDKPGKGAFYATPLDGLLKQAGTTNLLFMGVTTEVCVQTSMREANDRGYDLPAAGGLHRELLPPVQGRRGGDDAGPGRDRRLDRHQRAVACGAAGGARLIELRACRPPTFASPGPAASERGRSSPAPTRSMRS
jgi:hypothetical protein